MRLNEVHITGFGKLTNQTYKFNEALNILKGFNEAGKTTLVNAILGVLYGFKGRSEEMRFLKEKYRPWDRTVPYRANLIVNFGDEYDYFIERDFEEDKLTFSKFQDGYELPCSLSLEEILADKLGLASGRLFKSTLLVKQEEVAELHKTELSDAIIRKVTESGSGVSVKEILQILADRLKEMHRGFGRQTPNPGPIKACLEEIKQLKSKLEEAAAYHDEYNEMLHHLRKKQEEREQLQKRFQELLPKVADFEEHCYNQERIAGLKQRLTHLYENREKIREKEAELNTYKTVSSLYKEDVLKVEKLQLAEFLDRKLNVAESLIDQANYEYQKLKGKRQLIQREMGNHSKTIASYYSVRYNEKNLNEARRLNVSIEKLNEEIVEKEARISELEVSPTKRFSWNFWVGLVLCMFSAAGLFAGSIWGYTIASILLVSGIIVIYFGGGNSSYEVSRELLRITQDEVERARGSLITYKRMLDGILDDDNIESFENKVKEQLQLKQKIQLLEEELRGIDLDPLEEELENLRHDAAQYLRQINEILIEAGVGSVEELREKIDELREVKVDIKLAEDALSFLTKDCSAEDIDRETEALDQEIGLLTRQTARMEISQEKYESMKDEMTYLETILNTAKEEEIKIAATVENFNKLILQGRDIWALEATLSDKEAELKQLELESKSIELASKLLQEATEEARSKLAPQVKDKVIKIFQWITKNKYQDVRLEMEGDQLVFQYMDSDFNRYRDVHFLSTGTRDQLYLALRIALGEYLTNCSTFPIFLDDPFVNFDSERLFKTIEILRVLAREHQIIWLTKDYNLMEDIQEAAITQM